MRVQLFIQKIFSTSKYEPVVFIDLVPPPSDDPVIDEILNMKKRYCRHGRPSRKVVVHECDKLFEEVIVNFESINFKWMTRLFNFVGLIHYLWSFKTARVRVEEVYQFYASLFYDRSEESTKIHDDINKNQFTIKEMETSGIMFMPQTRMRIEQCHYYSNLPFMCTEEDFGTI